MPIVLFAGTFLLWIAAKGRLNDYVQLATTASASPSGVGTGPGSPEYPPGEPGKVERNRFGRTDGKHDGETLGIPYSYTDDGHKNYGFTFGDMIDGIGNAINNAKKWTQ
jgi:hypothetical protein